MSKRIAGRANKNDAEKIKKALEKEGFNPYIIETETCPENDVCYHVRIPVENNIFDASKAFRIAMSV